MNAKTFCGCTQIAKQWALVKIRSIVGEDKVYFSVYKQAYFFKKQLKYFTVWDTEVFVKRFQKNHIAIRLFASVKRCSPLADIKASNVKISWDLNGTRVGDAKKIRDFITQNDFCFINDRLERRLFETTY
ncbi:hypothetical protein GTA51_18330 [Desulfovibrio aerotolerans]|uniref:Uncharacterized protein n=1 Tax=Solidesulfovibrio aerotolerans TaxID=295255 RepID=A0A7C9MR08_9BACT|nr:hypothetical protein [Solidesulfovibrio aerotolerans]MYL85072.1 hypothetical protein [Solidesulfovibrio aerotolerans]